VRDVGDFIFCASPAILRPPPHSYRATSIAIAGTASQFVGADRAGLLRQRLHGNRTVRSRGSKSTIGDGSFGHRCAESRFRREIHCGVPTKGRLSGGQASSDVWRSRVVGGPLPPGASQTNLELAPSMAY